MQNVAYAEAYAFRSAVTGPPIASPASNGRTLESCVVNPIGVDSDAAVSIKNGKHIRRGHGVWSTASATVCEVVCEAGVEVEFSGRRPVIVMALEQVGGRLEIGPRGSHVAPSAITIDQSVVAFVPGGVSSRATSREMRFLRLFTLELDVSSTRLPSMCRLVAAPDSQLSKLCRLLAVECKGPDFNGRDYADNLVAALIIALSHADVGQTSSKLKGGLAPWQLRRTQEHMIEHLTEIVAVKDLAELAEISMTHFSRAFKESVGIAPLQWMTERRIELAKRKLLEGDMPIVEISLALGFCDQAHFTRVFRRAVGMTPLIWQRARRD